MNLISKINFWYAVGVIVMTLLLASPGCLLVTKLTTTAFYLSVVNFISAIVIFFKILSQRKQATREFKSILVSTFLSFAAMIIVFAWYVVGCVSSAGTLVS
ncbi:MAG: hypothetical protein Q7S09_00035 [bacterium]|nr:hypothetical protein [bacterium]